MPTLAKPKDAAAIRTTLLEYVLTHFLGEPTRRGKVPGMSYWSCPQCESTKFHTLPHLPRQYKDYAKCHACGFWGDVKGMLKHFHPDEPYDVRLDILEQLKREWSNRSKVLLGGVEY